jgi:hypothetical protein
MIRNFFNRQPYGYPVGGQTLTQRDTRWNRVVPADWTVSLDSTAHFSTLSYSQTAGYQELVTGFYGTGVRVWVYYQTGRPSFTITIDGTNTTVNQVGSGVYTYVDITGLTAGFHSLRINSPGGGYIVLGDVDIYA